MNYCDNHGAYSDSCCPGCEGDGFNDMADVRFLDTIARRVPSYVTNVDAFTEKIEAIKQRLAAAPTDPAPPMDPKELAAIRHNVDEHFAQFLIAAGVDAGSPKGLDAHRTLWHYMGIAIQDAHLIGREEGLQLAQSRIKNHVLKAIEKGVQP